MAQVHRATRGSRFGLKNNPMGSITTRINPETGQLEYYSEDENVGEAKPGFGGRILRSIASVLNRRNVCRCRFGSTTDRYKPKGYYESLDLQDKEVNALGILLIRTKITLTNDVPMESLTQG